MTERRGDCVLRYPGCGCAWLLLMAVAKAIAWIMTVVKD